MSRLWIVVIVVLAVMDAIWTGLFVAIIVWIHRHHHPINWWR